MAIPAMVNMVLTREENFCSLMTCSRCCNGCHCACVFSVLYGLCESL